MGYNICRQSTRIRSRGVGVLPSLPWLAAATANASSYPTMFVCVWIYSRKRMLQVRWSKPKPRKTAQYAKKWAAIPAAKRRIARRRETTYFLNLGWLRCCICWWGSLKRGEIWLVTTISRQQTGYQCERCWRSCTIIIGQRYYFLSLGNMISLLGTSRPQACKRTRLKRWKCTKLRRCALAGLAFFLQLRVNYTKQNIFSALWHWVLSFVCF